MHNGVEEPQPLSPTCSLGGAVTRQGALGCAAGAGKDGAFGTARRSRAARGCLPNAQEKKLRGTSSQTQLLAAEAFRAEARISMEPARTCPRGAAGTVPTKPSSARQRHPHPILPKQPGEHVHENAASSSEQPAFCSSLLFMLVWAANSISRL